MRDSKRRSVRNKILLRLPLILMFCFWGFVLLSFPLIGFTSDVSIIGYMGEDLANGEIWPIVMYGTDKQVSSTPYLHAVIALLTGKALGPLTTLKMAGGVFGFLGVWLLYEALISSMRLKGRSSESTLVAGTAFCLVLGSNISFLVSLGDVSLTEQYHFCIGLQVFLITALSRRLLAGQTVPTGGWALLGIAVSYSYVVRPNAFLFGAAGCALLFLFYAKRVLKWKAILPFVGGLVLAYLPVVWHIACRRDSWPVGAFVPPLSFSNASEIGGQFRALTTEVLPYLFLFDRGSAPLTFFGLFWCLLALVGLVRLLHTGWRKFEQGSLVIEGTLLGGSLLVVGLMLFVRGVCVDWASSRYCLALVPVVAWWVVVGMVRGRKSWLAVLFVSVLLTVFQVPPLLARLRTEAVRATVEVDSIDRLNEKYPGRLFFAKFWDAYEMDFVSSGSPAMVPFPFDNTRLFGRYAQRIRSEKPLWLIEEEQLDDVVSKAQEVTPEIRFDEVESLNIRGRPYRILESQAGSGARMLHRASPPYLVPQPTLPSWAGRGDVLSVEWLSVGEGARRVGQAIQSPAGESDMAIVAYGPYLALHPGKYKARFHLKAEAGEGTGELLCEVVQPDRPLAQKLVETNGEASEMVLEIPFQVRAPRSTLEFRVWKAGRYTLTLQEVELEILEGR